METFQRPVICGKCSAALSCLSSLQKNVSGNLIAEFFYFFGFNQLINWFPLDKGSWNKQKQILFFLCRFGDVSSVDMKTA